MIRLKRVYETPSREDGCRILVDKLWPRGLRKEKAAIDLWLKEVAPSSDLRKWFKHDPEKWVAFKHRYWKELADQGEAIKEIRHQAKNGVVTLVYAAKDEEHNNAVVLKEYLEKEA